MTARISRILEHEQQHEHELSTSVVGLKREEVKRGRFTYTVSGSVQIQCSILSIASKPVDPSKHPSRPEFAVPVSG
jgi:hypothetical protein